jgi:hypothetical protein
VKSLCLILFLAISATPACSRFTSKGRQERAYAKYVRKSMIHHEKQKAWFRRDKARIPKPDATAPSEPQLTTQTSENPESVPGDSNNQ